MFRHAVVGAIVLLGSAAIATVPSSAEAQEKPGRYTMSPVDGGFLRLDTETGALALCKKKGEQWACEPVEGPRGTEGGAAAPKPQVQLPSESEIDRAIDELERLFKKYRERLREFDRSLNTPDNRSQPPAPAPAPAPGPPTPPGAPKSDTL